MEVISHSRLRVARWLTGAGAAGLLGAAAVQRDWRGALGTWWSGESHRLIDIVHGGCWWGWLVAGLLLAGLWATAGWWARARDGAFPGPAPRAPRWFWVGLVLLTLAGGMLRAPRLGFSLYNDEAYAFRRHISGMVPVKDSGHPEKFRQAKWVETFYDNRVGNNSLPFSLSARWSYDAWRKGSGAPPGTVNEPALRLPAFLCGTLAIAAAGCLVWRLRGPGAGLLAAALTAFHPWHMRYGVEARGYALLLLVMPLLFLALHHALRGGRWRAWLAFGALEYLTVSCFFGTVHFLVALNGGLLLLAAWHWRRERTPVAASRILWPTLVAGTLAAAVYLAVQTPHFLQTVKLMNDPAYLRGEMGWAWYQDAGGFLTFGFPWLDPDPQNAAQLSGTRFPGIPAGGMLVLAWGFAGLLGVGAWRLLRQGSASAAVPVAVAGGALLTAGYCQAKGLYLMPWYCIFLLPLVPVLLASAVPLGQGWRRWSVPAVVLAAVLGLTWPAGLSLYGARGRENLRGVVERVYGTLPPVDSEPGPPVPLLGQAWSESPVYLPAIRTISNGADLEALVKESGEAKRPLYVEFAFREQARAANPEVLDRLENSGDFEFVDVFPGLEQPITTHYLFRKIP